jgi:hypothetical protein
MRTDVFMSDEKIKVRVTESGQTIEVVALNKRADRIEIVIGEGVHSVRCELTPTRNALAYVGNAMGREIVYERTRADLKADIDRVNPTLRKSTRERVKFRGQNAIGWSDERSDTTFHLSAPGGS